MDREHTYRSYLLRLWPAEMNGVIWRASLECVQTKETYGFDDLESLCDFLRQQTLDGPDIPEPPEKKE